MDNFDPCLKADAPRLLDMLPSKDWRRQRPSFLSAPLIYIQKPRKVANLLRMPFETLLGNYLECSSLGHEGLNEGSIHNPASDEGQEPECPESLVCVDGENLHKATQVNDVLVVAGNACKGDISSPVKDFSAWS